VIRHPKRDTEKRQCTLHMTYFAEGEEDIPRMPPVIVFKAQPEGHDDEDSDWEGDVEVTRRLDDDDRLTGHLLDARL